MLGTVVEVTVTVSCGSCGCDGSDGGDDGGGDSGDNRDNDGGDCGDDGHGDSGDNRDGGGDGDGAEDVLVALAIVTVVDGSADGSGNIQGDCRRVATSPGPSCLFRS